MAGVGALHHRIGALTRILRVRVNAWPGYNLILYKSTVKLVPAEASQPAGQMDGGHSRPAAPGPAGRRSVVIRGYPAVTACARSVMDAMLPDFFFAHKLPWATTAYARCRVTGGGCGGGSQAGAKPE